jgi:hypothetical protein
MTAKELLEWIKENAYKVEPHEPARSNGELICLTEALMVKLEELANQS